MNCILFQKFRNGTNFCVTVLVSLAGFKETCPDEYSQRSSYQERLCHLFSWRFQTRTGWNSEQLDVSMALPWAWCCMISSGPFQPELSHGPGFVSVFLLCQIGKLKSGFWTSVNYSCPLICDVTKSMLIMWRTGRWVCTLLLQIYTNWKGKD